MVDKKKHKIQKFEQANVAAVVSATLGGLALLSVVGGLVWFYNKKAREPSFPIIIGGQSRRPIPPLSSNIVDLINQALDKNANGQLESSAKESSPKTIEETSFYDLVLFLYLHSKEIMFFTSWSKKEEAFVFTITWKLNGKDEIILVKDLETKKIYSKLKMIERCHYDILQYIKENEYMGAKITPMDDLKLVHSLNYLVNIFGMNIDVMFRDKFEYAEFLWKHWLEKYKYDMDRAK